MQKCSSCGTIGEDDDVYCGNCGELLRQSRYISEEAVALLRLGEPKDGLKKLVSKYPWVLDSEEDFSAAVNRVYSGDAKTRLQCSVSFASGVAAKLRSHSVVSIQQYATLANGLCRDCGFSPEVAEQCLADWAYALDVKLPAQSSEPVAENSKPGAVSTAPAFAKASAVTSSAYRQAAMKPPAAVSSPLIKPATANIAVGSVSPTAGKSRSSAWVWIVVAAIAIGWIWLIGVSCNSGSSSTDSSSMSPVVDSEVSNPASGPTTASESMSTDKPALPSEPAVEGEDWHVNLSDSLGLDLVWCPPGTFTMGSPSSEVGHESMETEHLVTLSKGFWMARYELTQEQYEALMGSNPSKYQGSSRPVEQVSWDDAVAYCQKLNRQCLDSVPSGYEITLPTEAQWEYACRAGTTSALNSGQELTSELGNCSNLDQVAWYVENSGSSTHSVGLKQANAWGLYDMHGNVWEWCSDWYSSSYGSNATDPVGPSTGDSRVFRGGSWYGDARYCRSAVRGADTPDLISFHLGFRPVCAPAK